MSEKLEQLLMGINDKIDQLLMRVEKIERKLNAPSQPDTRDMVFGPGSRNPTMAQSTIPSPTSGLADQINKMREELMSKYMKDGKPIMPEMPEIPSVPSVGGMGGSGMPGMPGMGGMGMPRVPGAGMPGMPDLATNMAQGIAETMKKSVPVPEEAENVKIKEEDEENG